MCGESPFSPITSLAASPCSLMTKLSKESHTQDKLLLCVSHDQSACDKQQTPLRATVWELPGQGCSGTGSERGARW